MTPEDAKKYIEEIRSEKLKANSEDLRAALKLLAEELNTKETHFILELLQNAEDNEYGGKTPQLSLSVVGENLTSTPSAEGCFVMVNNEIGFQKENVRSLSSVGQSTKKQRLHGYIGEKGIGFKSVFRITSNPHIFSNGFRFCFELPDDAGGLGYILPHWINFVPEVVQDGETTLLLPLLPGKRQMIAEQLSKIAPETALFLRKLKSLKLGDARVISRGGNLPFITLKSNEDESPYYVYYAEWPRPDDLMEEKRQGVKMREISVAFPLKNEAVCTGKVFAFLPTEFNTGLPFLVNADFILNFNRERILEDRRWNQWLRDQIAPTFVNAFMAILEEKEWRVIANKFLPVDSDLTPGSEFFSPVVSMINAVLKEQPCILTDTGVPALPKNVVSPGRTARELLSEVPRERFTFSLLNEAWESGWRTRLKPLGVEALTFVKLFNLLNDTEWLGTRNLDWWEKLLELASSCNIKADDIGDFPILLCQDGTARPIATGIFFNADNQPDQNEFLPEWPPVLIFHVELQKRLEGKPAVFNWFASVTKIQRFSVAAYLSGKLIPWMSCESGEGVGPLLVNATKFIATHLSSFDETRLQGMANEMSWVLQGSQILTPKNRTAKELVTPACLEKEADWTLVFASADDRKHFCVLSDEYFTECDEDGRAKMVKLMSVCKATSCPDPAKRVDVNGLADWECPSWLKELNAEKFPANLAEHSLALERWIGKFQLPYFSKFLVSKHENSAFNVRDEPKPSEFCECLKNHPWMKSSKGYVCPSRAFVDDSEIRSFLGDSVAYVSTELPVAVLEKLNVGVQLTAATLLNLLRQMQGNGSPDKVLAVRIYQRLQTLDFDTTVFRQEPLILLIEPKTRWETLDRVFWLDAGSVFDEDFGYAELTYENDDLHGFFTKKLAMSNQPAAREYADVWVGLSRSTSISRDVVEAKLGKILPEVAKVGETEFLLSSWRHFKLRVKVWTTNGGFEARPSAFVPDDSNAEALFKDSAKIAWVPEHYSSAKISAFLRMIGCPSLSEHLKSFATVSEPTKTGNYDRFLTQPSRELLVCWVCRFDGWTDRKELLESLMRTEEAITPRIVLQHSLDQEGVPNKEQEATAYWDSRKHLLYLRENSTSKAQQAMVAVSIADKFFRNNRTAVDTVYRLLSLEDEDAEREMAERKWILSGPQQEWIKSLGIDLAVLRVTEKEKRRKSSGRPEAADSAKPTDGATNETSGLATQTTTQTTKSEKKQQSGDKGALDNEKSSHGEQVTNPTEEARTDANQGESAGGGDTVENEGVSLKSVETEVEFVHVSGYTRSAPKKRPREQSQTTTQREEKSGLTETSQKSKQELEDRAFEIIKRQFQTNVDFAGYKLKDRRKDLCGYDLLAEKPGSVLRIEIKSHARESKSVFVTKREWDESRIKDQLAREDRWELWNVENLASQTGMTKITRYGTVPQEALSEEVGYWLNLIACSR